MVNHGCLERPYQVATAARPFIDSKGCMLAKLQPSLSPNISISQCPDQRLCTRHYSFAVESMSQWCSGHLQTVCAGARRAPAAQTSALSPPPRNLYGVASQSMIMAGRGHGMPDQDALSGRVAHGERVGGGREAARARPCACATRRAR
jgi:hypothetical protein